MRVFFAGAEQQGKVDILQEVGVKNVLVSYVYMDKYKKGLKEYKKKFDEVFLYSGAHTFFTMSGDEHRAGGVKRVKLSILKGMIKGYFKGFLDYCIDQQKYYDWVAELDLYPIIGKKKVEEMRKEMDEHGLKVLPVFHPECLSFGYYNQMLKEYEFVAIGGWHTDEQIKMLMMRARKGENKIHLFGFTKWQLLNELGRFMPYSVDSMTWLMGSKYGITYIFDRNKMVILDKDEKMRRFFYMRQARKVGVDVKKWLKDDYNEVNKFNLVNMMEYEAYLNRRFKLEA